VRTTSGCTGAVIVSIHDPEDRIELLPALEPHDEIGLEHVDLVVLHELAADPADLPAGVHDHEVGPFTPCPLPQPLEGAHQRDEVILGRGRPDEPQGVGLGHPLHREIVRLPDVLHADRRRRPDRLLRHVGVEIRDRPADPQRVRGGRACERALARVKTADEHHGPRVASGSVDELLVLVHG
jgi:hypothetical protein